jgi:hypothetical protein
VGLRHCITKGLQTVDTDVSDEEGFGRSKGEDDSHALIMNDIPILRPHVDNGRLGYVRIKKRCIRLCVARSKAIKKKAKNNSLSKTPVIKAKLNNVNLQVDENLLASLNSSDVRTSIASSIDAILTAEGDG